MRRSSLKNVAFALVVFHYNITGATKFSEQSICDTVRIVLEAAYKRSRDVIRIDRMQGRCSHVLSLVSRAIIVVIMGGFLMLMRCRFYVIHLSDLIVQASQRCGHVADNGTQLIDFHVACRVQDVGLAQSLHGMRIECCRML